MRRQLGVAPTNTNDAVTKSYVDGLTGAADVTRIVSAATNIANVDLAVFANAAAGGFTITLPAASTATVKPHTVKKVDSTSNAVTVASSGGTIDGSTTAVITTPYLSLTFVTDGTNWNVI